MTYRVRFVWFWTATAVTGFTPLRYSSVLFLFRMGRPPPYLCHRSLFRYHLPRCCTHLEHCYRFTHLEPAHHLHYHYPTTPAFYCSPRFCPTPYLPVLPYTCHTGGKDCVPSSPSATCAFYPLVLPMPVPAVLLPTPTSYPHLFPLCLPACTRALLPAVPATGAIVNFPTQSVLPHPVTQFTCHHTCLIVLFLHSLYIPYKFQLVLQCYAPCV